MKAFICAADILIKVLASGPAGDGHYSYAIGLRNVTPSCADRPSAYWALGGEHPGLYVSTYELPVDSGLYYWANVTAECERMDGGFENGIRQKQWLCEIGKLELLK
jgi:hypothetical protein